MICVVAMRKLALAFVVLALASGTTGCRKIQEKIAKKAAEKAIETASSGDGKTTKVDLGDDGTATVKVEDDKTGAKAMWGAGAKLPDDWPSDVPAYPGKIQVSSSTPESKVVMIKTSDDGSKVLAFYKSKLSGAKKVAEATIGTNTTGVWTQGSEQISVTADDQGDETSVTVAVTKKN